MVCMPIYRVRGYRTQSGDGGGGANLHFTPGISSSNEAGVTTVVAAKMISHLPLSEETK